MSTPLDAPTLATLRELAEDLESIVQVVSSRDGDATARQHQRAQAVRRVVRLAEAEAPRPVCKYGDPFCPCQDGDSCHYEDTATTKAMAPPPPAEAIAAAVKRVTEMVAIYDHRGRAMGEAHPDAAALRLLLALAAQHVPVEDRELALDLAIPDADDGHDGDSDTCPRCLELDEARRLLKLEDTDAE